MRPYFPKLDSIRFYAFLIVFISHSYFNSKNDLAETYPILLEKGDKWFAHGEVGVQIFFMLSGFLILYLAIQQIQKTDSFSILQFLKKRVLRIWPLYFLMIGISYALYLIQGKAIALGCTSMYLYFLGNICVYQGLPDVVSTITIGPLWSVSVEEQFYLIFPFLFLCFLYGYRKNKKRAVQIFTSLLVIIIALTTYNRYLHTTDWLYLSYASVSALPALASGMLLAVLVSTKQQIFTKIAVYKKTAVVLGVITSWLAFHLKFSQELGVTLYLLPIILLTALAIVHSVFGEKDVEGKSARWSQITRYLGQISYGLYVYHMFAIVIANYVYRTLGAIPGYLPNIYAKIIVTLALTIFLAHLSYKYFEKWFLRFK